MFWFYRVTYYSTIWMILTVIIVHYCQALCSFETPDAFHACFSFISSTIPLIFCSNDKFNGFDLEGCNWCVVLSAYSIELCKSSENESNLCDKKGVDKEWVNSFWYHNINFNKNLRQVRHLYCPLILFLFLFR